MRIIQERSNQLKLEIAAKEREKRHAEDALFKASDVTEKTLLIEKLGPAIDSYMSRLTRAKVAMLQSEVTECFNRLARKSDFVRRVEIDPDTFAVTVIDKRGQSIPKEDLSSGEKQIFAIAVLWGLARTSGRSLPVVIDTPLGRLDSDHRRNLIDNYFPRAGHQVILLSTDTEVDLPLFESLQASISHCYHLKYDEKEDRTIVEDRYFW
jgi:DNA sulfur modification protein DndD